MGANPLSRLIKQADAASETASVLLKRTIREIRHDLADLSPSLNLAGSADDREKAYNLVRRRFARLSRLLDTLMAAANTAAAKAAAKAAGQMTGLEVKYSPSRAKAICELVTPAQGENLAAVFTDKMAVQLINSLREATVATLRDQAVIGGTLKDMKRDLADRWALAAKVENPTFTDASGRRWDTQTYFQMNVRTNTMRVYNDCLVDDVAREVGTDVMRISTGGDPDCACAAWEGCIISVSGKTKGLPTYDDARNGGCFHPNCTHTLEYVDEVADADEIALQKGHPAQKGLEDDPDAQDERKYQIDQARYMRDNPGMTQEQARVAVDRDNLAASIQSGLIREDAREIVSKMTDAQVTALCPNGNPPAFEPVKRIPGGTRAEPKHETERWNHGSRGGVFHVKRNASAEHILELLDADKAKQETRKATGMTKADKWKARAMQSAAEAELEIERVQIEEAKANAEKYGYPPITTRHTEEDDARAVNQNFKTRAWEWTHNCQRCVVAYEMRRRGIDVVALPKPRDERDGIGNAFKDSEQINILPKTPNEHVFDAYRREISGNSDQVGARYIIYLKWNEFEGHVVIAEKTADGFMTIDAQSSRIRTSEKENRAFMGGAKNTRMNYQRIDNAEIIRRVADQCAVARRK